MLRNANLGKEIVITSANRPGLLARVSGLVAAKGINIESISGYTIKEEAVILMVTNDLKGTIAALRQDPAVLVKEGSGRTKDAQRGGDVPYAIESLERAGVMYVEEEEVIIGEAENKPGLLKEIADRLAADKIDIKHIYSTICSAGCSAKIILATSDNRKALLKCS